MNPKMMKQMMRQLGMQMKELNADEVIIRLKDKELVIRQPQVSRISVGGQETFQVVGVPEERTVKKKKFSAEDVKMVAEQAKVSEAKARKALEETGGDIAEAIMKLQK